LLKVEKQPGTLADIKPELKRLLAIVRIRRPNAGQGTT
jgi:hypothetical protein